VGHAVPACSRDESVACNHVSRRTVKKIPSHTTFILLKLNKLLGQHVSIIYDHLQAPIDILFLSEAELH
jgi:hypothetical protein